MTADHPPRSAARLLADAQAIWHAAVEAVRADRLVADAVRVVGDELQVGDEALDLTSVRRIEVVGAGKAGAAMAAGLLAALGPRVLAEKDVRGWVNVPADCVADLERIHLHAGRPAGSNEPTAAGVAGAEEILGRVAGLGPQDLCLCLLSGGASALLPAPAEGVSLADKLAVTRLLSAAGANIAELNAVRKQLSRIKGGGLLRACGAGRLLTLVISDVIGDPLDVIGSGPTVPDTSTAADALAVLARFALTSRVPARVLQALESRRGERVRASGCAAHTVVIGNLATAVDAAGQAAERLGYAFALEAATRLEPSAEEVGRRLAQLALDMRDHPGPNCLISGGEPVVQLAPPELRGLGGRNQQLVLAASELLGDCREIVLLSAGTDGEDGPTDAAGAWVNEEVLAAARQRGLAARPFLARNDAYRFFEPLGALLKSGPTHTNVCDVRVIVVNQSAADGKPSTS